MTAPQTEPQAQTPAAPAQPQSAVQQASAFINANLDLEAVKTGPPHLRAILRMVGKLYINEVGIRERMAQQLVKIEGAITTVRQAMLRPDSASVLSQMGLTLESAPQWLAHTRSNELEPLQRAHAGIDGNTKEWASDFAAVLKQIQEGESTEALHGKVAELSEANAQLVERLEALEATVAALSPGAPAAEPSKPASKSRSKKSGKASSDTLGE